MGQWGRDYNMAFIHELYIKKSEKNERENKINSWS